MGVGKYAALCKCMYIFIIENQLTTQNNDKICPETFTGTVFSIKNKHINHNMATSSRHVCKREVRGYP